MDRRIVALTSLMLATWSAAGCLHSERHPPIRQARSEHLLFNPSWTGLRTVDIQRAGWPTTVRYLDDAEEFKYTERIIDQADSFGSLPDRYYRRFDAVRKGRGYR
ncbi:MAG: hypothetical protein ACE5HE_05100 [Phycisphaerae bacterium]